MHNFDYGEWKREYLQSWAIKQDILTTPFPIDSSIQGEERFYFLVQSAQDC